MMKIWLQESIWCTYLTTFFPSILAYSLDNFVAYLLQSLHFANAFWVYLLGFFVVMLYSIKQHTCSQYLFQSLLMMNSELVLCRIIRSQLGQLKFCRRDKFVTCLWTNMGFFFFFFMVNFWLKSKPNYSA